MRRAQIPLFSCKNNSKSMFFFHLWRENNYPSSELVHALIHRVIRMTLLHFSFLLIDDIPNKFQRELPSLNAWQIQPGFKFALCTCPISSLKKKTPCCMTAVVIAQFYIKFGFLAFWFYPE